MTKNMATCVILACISALQTGCIAGNLKDAPPPAPSVEATVIKTQPLACDDLLADDDMLPPQVENKTSATQGTLVINSRTEVCLKLREAIRLSTPYSKHQSDKKALVILKELRYSTVLPDTDLHINNILLQHVAQRQNLRKVIGAQDRRLKKAELQNKELHDQLKTLQSQLDQLKNIEVEIDKKERSVTSPIGE